MFANVFQDVEAFRRVIQEYQKWAAELFPTGLNILDFARTTENELSGESKREALLNYRVEHLRREGVFKTKEEEERLKKAEENRAKAIEKRRLKAMEVSLCSNMFILYEYMCMYYVCGPACGCVRMPGLCSASIPENTCFG